MAIEHWPENSYIYSYLHIQETMCFGWPASFALAMHVHKCKVGGASEEAVKGGVFLFCCRIPILPIILQKPAPKYGRVYVMLWEKTRCCFIGTDGVVLSLKCRGANNCGACGFLDLIDH